MGGARSSSKGAIGFAHSGENPIVALPGDQSVSRAYYLLGKRKACLGLCSRRSRPPGAYEFEPLKAQPILGYFKE
jgi:hypothetical protein